MTTDESPQTWPGTSEPEGTVSPSDDTLTTFVAVMSLFAAGMALGGLAGQLKHPFAAVALVLPAVSLAAYLYRRQVAGVIAFGGMASWALTRDAVAVEPAWSILFTFIMSLLILFGTGWLIESLLAARDRARYYEQTDSLTGLLNRNAFLERLQAEIERSRRLGHPLAVAFLDCDHFKNWNDTRGHLAGDEVLKLIASMLQVSTRSYDGIARMGGDEFAVLFPELDPDLAAKATRRIQSGLRRELQRREWMVTVSIGLVSIEKSCISARDIISLADKVMYDAKRLGKDRVQILIDPPADYSGAEFDDDIEPQLSTADSPA